MTVVLLEVGKRNTFVHVRLKIEVLKQQKSVRMETLLQFGVLLCLVTVSLSQGEYTPHKLPFRTQDFATEFKG